MNPGTNDNGWSRSYPSFSSSYPPRRAPSFLEQYSASDRRTRRHSYSNGNGNNRIHPWTTNITADAPTTAVLARTTTTTSLISISSDALRQLENEMLPQSMDHIRLENVPTARPDTSLNSPDHNIDTSTEPVHQASSAQLPVEAFSFGCRAHDSNENTERRSVSLPFMNESLPFLSRASSNQHRQSWSSSFPMLQQQPNVTLAELIQQVLDITETVLSFSDDNNAADETKDHDEHSTILDDGEGDDDDGEDNDNNYGDLQNTNNEGAM